MEFRREEEFKRFVAESLQLGEEPDGDDKAILEAAAELCFTSPPAQTDRSFVVNFLVGKWVIRDGDLDVFKAVREGLLAWSASSFAIRGNSYSALVGMLFAAMQLFRNLRRFGAKLNPNQALVLLTLRDRGGGMTICEMLAVLGKPWSSSSLLATLKSLQQVRVKSGLISFVACTSAGVWTSIDV